MRTSILHDINEPYSFQSQYLYVLVQNKRYCYNTAFHRVYVYMYMYLSLLCHTEGIIIISWNSTGQESVHFRIIFSNPVSFAAYFQTVFPGNLACF